MTSATRCLKTVPRYSRSISAAISAGLKIGRIEIDHREGKVVIIPEGMDDSAQINPCDRLLK